MTWSAVTLLGSSLINETYANIRYAVDDELLVRAFVDALRDVCHCWQETTWEDPLLDEVDFLLVYGRSVKSRDMDT